MAKTTKKFDCAAKVIMREVVYKWPTVITDFLPRQGANLQHLATKGGRPQIVRRCSNKKHSLMSAEIWNSVYFLVCTEYVDR